MVLRAKLRIFLDTNVIFSGFYSDRGVPAAILGHHIRGDIRMVVSQQVLDEVIQILKEKFPNGLPTLKRLLLNASPEIVSDPRPEQIRRWIKELSVGDAAILAAAIQANPDYFVTGDKHFLKNPGLAEKARLQIIPPSGMVRIIENSTK
jgi:putative PIN family toxin of toxin-antitoxin system